MTAVLAETSTTGGTPGVEGLAQVHAAIDLLDETDVGQVSGHDVAEVDRAMSRLAAVKLSLVATAHRQGAAQRDGMTNTGAWLAAHTRSWGADAAADVLLATALDSSLPATRLALAEGALSPDHASVIAGVASRLPATLTDVERAKVEAALVAQAKRVDPARLRRSARRALLAAERSAEESLAHEDAELRNEEDRARRRVRLTMHDNLDGTITGHFTVPTLAGAILRKTIQQMISPRRRSAPLAGAPGPQRSGSCAASVSGGSADSADSAHSPGRTGSADSGGSAGSADSSGSAGNAGAPDPGRERAGASATPAPTRDWAHLSGAAFVELLEHLPTEHLNGKVAATVVVTVEHERLREQLGAAHLDTGHDVSAAEARRLACSAGILPAILDGTSLPLDLGRTRRFFTEPQRVALATIYEQCAADGCDRPYAWTELHHEDPWATGGLTNLDLAVPLCGPDHHRAHDPRYELTVTTDPHGRKGVTFRRRN